jgi:hypothetical protein
MHLRRLYNAVPLVCLICFYPVGCQQQAYGGGSLLLYSTCAVVTATAKLLICHSITVHIPGLAAEPTAVQPFAVQNNSSNKLDSMVRQARSSSTCSLPPATTRAATFPRNFEMYSTS